MFARMQAIKCPFPIWPTVLIAVACCFATLLPLAVAEANSEGNNCARSKRKIMMAMILL